MAHMYQSKDRSVLRRLIDNQSSFVYRSEGTDLLSTLEAPGPSAPFHLVHVRSNEFEGLHVYVLKDFYLLIQ